MENIDLGYALFIWNTDKQGCLYCPLKNTSEYFPKNCSKDGHYKLYFGDDKVWYYKMIAAREWKERNRKRREERLKNQNNDQESNKYM